MNRKILKIKEKCFHAKDCLTLCHVIQHAKNWSLSFEVNVFFRSTNTMNTCKKLR